MPEKDIARLHEFRTDLRELQPSPYVSVVPLLLKNDYIVKFRIYFKICTITFRTLKDNQPAYEADLLAHNIYAPQISIDLLFMTT